MTVSVGSSICPPEALLNKAPRCTALTELDTLFEITGCGLKTQDAKDEVTLVAVTNQALKLAYWPPALCEFTAISSIDLSGNAITSIPQSIQTLTGLKVLSLARNNLTSVPAELCCLSSLTELDLSRNELRALHPDFCKLKQLQALNLMGNQIGQLPEQFGNLSSLIRLGLKSNKLAELPASFTQLTNLVELFLTDNQLNTLPQGFGNLKSLVKLQASFNPFMHLPDDMWQLQELEMFRLAVGHLQQWPPNLTRSGGLPKLAWCSLGRNPAAAPVPPISDSLPRVDIHELVLGDKLGQGASGEVFKGLYNGKDVAIKIFLSDVSPDGSTKEEMAINCAVRHANLTKVLALVTGTATIPPHIDGAAQQAAALPSPASTDSTGSGDSGLEGTALGVVHDIDLSEVIGMVLELVEGRPLAGRPTSEHLLRCKWPEGQVYSILSSLTLCHGVTSSLAYLHSKGICHGDVYAHNIMVNQAAVQQGDPVIPVLCDFGAAYCYDRATSDGFWECMEVRAFGLIMKDVVDRTTGGSDLVKQQLQELVDGCLAANASDRPEFYDVESKLLRLMCEFGIQAPQE